MSNTDRTIVIGTRGSDLAMWQAKSVEQSLDVPTEIMVVKTAGDRFLDISLQGKLEKGFFTKEIEEKLLDGEIDLAVHSLKDLPVESPEGLAVSAYLKRAPVSDLILVHPGWHDPERVVPVKEGAKVGATSLRRQALLAIYAPEAEAAFLRGNVPTRVRKCREEEYGAIVVARAGVERLELDLDPLMAYELNPAIWLPAPGQGAVAVQTRSDDRRVISVLAGIDDEATRDAVNIERELLAKYEGGCHTAFGAWARMVGDRWDVTVGMDQPGEGWGQTEFDGSIEECLARGPETLSGYAVRMLADGESLCQRLR